MKIRFLRGWGENYVDGQVVDFPEGMALELLRRGIAVAVLETESPAAPPSPAPKPRPKPQAPKPQARPRNEGSHGPQAHP